jgi:hypothetical protein
MKTRRRHPPREVLCPPHSAQAGVRVAVELRTATRLVEGDDRPGEDADVVDRQVEALGASRRHDVRRRRRPGKGCRTALARTRSCACRSRPSPGSAPRRASSPRHSAAAGAPPRSGRRASRRDARRSHLQVEAAERRERRLSSEKPRGLCIAPPASENGGQRRPFVGSPSGATNLNHAGFGLAERRRSRTYPRMGYMRLPIFKTARIWLCAADCRW